MSYQHIVTDRQLVEFCAALRDEPTICFDTEFVSEHTYRSELCLIQVAAGEHLAVIDPLTIHDVRPFWDLLVASGHETIVHAGREELNFCFQATGKPPAGLFDVQLAAGLVGNDYPAGYGALLHRTLGITLEKGETRTDWRKRPLSDRQMEYALDDVRHLTAISQALRKKLKETGREAWMEEEIVAWRAEIDDYRNREHWRRMAGINGLNRRCLAVLRELWLWRETEAKRRNQPARRILRDDLVVEIAKRRSADPKQIQAVRGMERSDLHKIMPEMSRAIETALAIKDEDLPRQLKQAYQQQYALLGQFLGTALASICRSQNVAASLVGTASDVRDLIAFRLGDHVDERPVLASGWREQVVGQLIEDLLEGKVRVHVENPKSEDPLRFEPM